jgi:hypothetical protein
VTEETTLDAKELTRRGYRRVSRKYRLVSRIDRPDFVEVLAEDMNHAPADFFTRGERRVEGRWCDYYRRGLSKDVLHVPDEAVFLGVPPSDHDDVGYVSYGGEEDHAHDEGLLPDHTERHFDAIDAAFFSGDTFHDPLALQRFTWYVTRWFDRAVEIRNELKVRAACTCTEIDDDRSPYPWVCAVHNKR